MTSNTLHPVVVIPVYKEIEDWTTEEFVSMQRCCQILASHPIYLVGPKKLNWGTIRKFVSTKFGKHVQLGLFENKYFSNIDGYNKLLKSLFFYKYFSNYSHLLIYQLDAYVFKDELLHWCGKGFDYIGAPWLEGFTDNTSTKFVGVGNGGFSLHNIKSAIKALKKIRTILPIVESCESTLLYKRVPLFKWMTRYILLKGIYSIKNQKYVLGLSLKDEIYEDKFWGRYIPTTFRWFKVASVEEALKFSFEVNPQYLYELNNKHLPFGCHAWEKYDYIFWKPFIQVNTTISVDLRSRNEN